MKNKKLIALIITCIYWIPSFIALINIINGSGDIFPLWLDSILMPGYIIGFGLGFASGSGWAIIGQLISFSILFFLSGSLVFLISKLYQKITSKK